MYRLTLVACLLMFVLTGSVFAQKKNEQTPVKLLMTNNSGFIQNGPGGPDNLVFLDFTPVYPEEDQEPDPPVEANYFIVGNMDSGADLDGNGVDDSIGSFVGLEWSTGVPRDGTLIGCVANDEVGDGEFYEIDPDTADAKLIGSAPLGLVVTLVPNGTGYAPRPLPFGTPLIGGSGNGLSAAFNVDANGDVIDLVILGPGEDYEIGDVVRMPGAGFQNATFLVTELGNTDFSDLAYNPIQNRMFAVRNAITDGGIGLNTLWADSDNDRVPDSFEGLLFNPKSGAPFATLIGGIYFDQTGRLYIYDAISGETVFPFGKGIVATVSPLDLETSDSPLGHGMTVVEGTLVIATDTPERASLISTFDLENFMPDPDEMCPQEDAIPQVFFPLDQLTFMAEVTVGDIVPAESALDDVPTFFPDSVLVNNGAPGNNAILEAVVVSDDFRYCVSGATPTKTSSPIDVSFVFTIPNPADLTVLAIDIEGQANVSNLESTVLIQNVKSGEFEEVETYLVSAGADETINVDLSANIAQFINPVNGTLTCRIQSRAVGLTFLFPWSIKYDSVLTLAE